EHVVFDGDAGGIAVSLIATAAGGWRLTLGASTVEVTQAHAADADVVLLARWEPGRLRLRVDDAAAEAARTAGTWTRAPIDADLGRRHDSAAGYLAGVLGPVVLFGAPLADAGVEVLRRLTRPPRWGESAPA
ncbi:MAG: hypothetical protein AB7G21_04410, partial [Dehalococcoidia bacterium]